MQFSKVIMVSTIAFITTAASSVGGSAHEARIMAHEAAQQKQLAQAMEKSDQQKLSVKKKKRSYKKRSFGRGVIKTYLSMFFLSGVAVVATALAITGLIFGVTAVMAGIVGIITTPIVLLPLLGCTLLGIRLAYSAQSDLGEDFDDAMLGVSVVSQVLVKS